MILIVPLSILIVPFLALTASSPAFDMFRVPSPVNVRAEEGALIIGEGSSEAAPLPFRVLIPDVDITTSEFFPMEIAGLSEPETVLRSELSIVRPFKFKVTLSFLSIVIYVFTAEPVKVYSPDSDTDISVTPVSSFSEAVTAAPSSEKAMSVDPEFAERVMVPEPEVDSASSEATVSDSELSELTLS